MNITCFDQIHPPLPLLQLLPCLIPPLHQLFPLNFTYSFVKVTESARAACKCMAVERPLECGQSKIKPVQTAALHKVHASPVAPALKEDAQ